MFDRIMCVWCTFMVRTRCDVYYKEIASHWRTFLDISEDLMIPCRIFEKKNCSDLFLANTVKCSRNTIQAVCSTNLTACTPNFCCVTISMLTFLFAPILLPCAVIKTEPLPPSSHFSQFATESRNK